QIEETIAHPPVVDPNVSLADVASREWQKLRKAAKSLSTEASDADLHRVRIKAKRARYSAELAAQDVGHPAERFVDRVKKLQDVLGEHQNAVVAEERLRKLSGHVGGRRTSFVGGRVV